MTELDPDPPLVPLATSEMSHEITLGEDANQLAFLDDR